MSDTNKENDLNLSRRHDHHRSRQSHSQSTFTSDAASSYYFSNIPKTPGVKSARKKYQKLHESRISIAAGSGNAGDAGGNAGDANADTSRIIDATKMNTNTNSLMEFDNDDDNSSTETSLLLSPTNNNTNASQSQIQSASPSINLNINISNTSLNTSIQNTTASSFENDNLNKSVLSDTTELTASNFVFCEKSRRIMLQSKQEKDSLDLEVRVKEVMEKKRFEAQQKEQELREQEYKELKELQQQQQQHKERKEREENTMEDIQNLLTSSTSKDTQEGEKDDTIDTAAMERLLDFDTTGLELDDDDSSMDDDLRDDTRSIDLGIGSNANGNGNGIHSNSIESGTANAKGGEDANMNMNLNLNIAEASNADIVNEPMENENEHGGVMMQQDSVMEESPLNDSHNFDLSDMMGGESDNDNDSNENDDVEEQEEEQEIVVRQATSATAVSKSAVSTSSIFIQSSLSSASASVSLLRRHSHIPEGTRTTNTGIGRTGTGTGTHRHSTSGTSPLTLASTSTHESIMFRKGAQSVKKLTASIQKARRIRETQRRDKSMSRNRLSLSSSRFQSPGFGTGAEVPMFGDTTAVADEDGFGDGDRDQNAQSENVLEENHSSNLNVNANNDSISVAAGKGPAPMDPNATFDATNYGINDILGDLVANNNDMDETMEHATPEKLNLSLQISISATSPERVRDGTGNNNESPCLLPRQPQPFKSPQMKRISVGKPVRKVAATSPGRNTRARTKKRLSGNVNANEELLLTKRSDRKGTPEKQSFTLSNRLSIASGASNGSLGLDDDDGDGENTEMMIEYLVANVEVEKDAVESNDLVDEEEEHSGLGNALMEEDAFSSSQKSINTDEIDSPGIRVDVESVQDDMGFDSQQQGLEALETAPSQESMSESSTLLLTCSSSEPTQPSSPSKSCSRSVNTNDILRQDTGDHESLGLASLSQISQRSASDSVNASINAPPSLSADKSVQSVLEGRSDSSTDTNLLLQGSLQPSKSGSAISGDKESKSDEALASAASSRLPDPKSPFMPPSSTKSRRMQIDSPLSGDEGGKDVIEDEDDADASVLSDNSPSSNASSSMSLRIDGADGDDGVTADTAALRDIMADLNDDFGKPSRFDRKKRQRRSSAFSLTSTEEYTSSSRQNELDTADTQDLKGLLSDMDTRGSSLLPINENEISISYASADFNSHVLNSPDPIAKPAANIQTPKSILKKRGRQSTPKRNVVFCPPTAAEYNVGSPAKHFTHMCSKATKKLFTIPQKMNGTSFLSTNASDEDSMDVESIDGDESLGVDSNLQALIANVNEGASPQSCASKHSDSSGKRDSDYNGGDTIGLESNLGAMLKHVADEIGVNLDHSQSFEATKEFSLRDSSMLQIMDGDTQTVGLDNDLKGLLNSCNNVNEKSSISCEEDAEDSEVDLDSSFESQSLAESTHGNEEATVELDKNMADLLNESNSPVSDLEETSTLSLKSSVVRAMEGDTIGLESDLIGMLKTAEDMNVRRDEPSFENTGTMSLNNSLLMHKMDGETIGMESDLKGMLDQVGIGSIEGDKSSVINASLLSMSNDNETFSTLQKESSNTIELESDLQGMIGKVDRFENQKAQRKIDEDDTISLHDISILQKSEGDTVGLEDELQGLITAAMKQIDADGKQSPPDSNSDEGNNLELDSSSESRRRRPSEARDGEEDTIAIEGNLESLLNANDTSTANSGPKDSSDTSQMVRSIERALGNDSDPSSIIELSRSNDSGRRNSRRFSLVPSSDVSIGPSELLGIYDSEDLAGDKSSTHNDIMHHEEQKQLPIDLKWKELFTYIPHLEKGQPLESDLDLLLDGSSSALAQYNHSEVIDKVQHFLLEVCGEIEESALDDDLNPEGMITNHFESDISALHDLQRAIRGDTCHAGMSNHIGALKELGDASSVTVQAQHVAWELQVMDALKSTIDEMKTDFYDDLQNVDRQLNLANDVDQSLLIISRQLVKMARQETMATKLVSYPQ